MQFLIYLKVRALCREANNLYGTYLDLCERPSQSLQLKMMVSKDCGFIADTIAQNSGIDYPEKIKLLSQLNSYKRLEMAVQLLRVEINMLRIESEIQEHTKAIMDQDHRDYYLRQQMRAIREELGEGPESGEYNEYE